MGLKYKIINEKDLYSGFFKLKKIEFIHQKHDGSWSGQVDREIFGGAHVSTLLPYDPERKEIVLIQQFRAGVISRYDEDYLYEIVAGIIDKDELAEDTAKRECFEETGCFEKMQSFSLRELNRPEDDRHSEVSPFSDPIFAICAHKT